MRQTGLVVHGMWDLPRSGIKPVSPTLASGFFTSEPPGKPLKLLLQNWFLVSYPQTSHTYQVYSTCHPSLICNCCPRFLLTSLLREGFGNEYLPKLQIFQNPQKNPHMICIETALTWPQCRTHHGQRNWKVCLRWARVQL